MDLRVIFCFGLLVGHAEAQMGQNIIATQISPGKFSHTLLCDAGTNVYVPNVLYSFNTFLCNCPCPSVMDPSYLGNVSAACWTSANCTVEFSTPSGSCEHVQAFISLLCAPVNPSLTINHNSSAAGSALTAGYSAEVRAASGDNASWVCSVEASDCSRVNVTVLLVIRNGNDAVSYFSVAGDMLGTKGVTSSRRILPTPFDVVLNVLPGSALLTAYFVVSAERNMTMTCGRQNNSPPTASCNVPIVSAPPSRKFGQALTAVHSSSGVETANSTWLCAVETADCSTGAPVDVSVFISNRGDTPASFFSKNGQRLNANYEDRLNAPFSLALNLVNGSDVVVAYVHVKATKNITLSRGRQANTPPTPFCNVPIVSTSPSSVSGEALVAVHSSSGVEKETSTWECVVGTADCSSYIPVDVSVLINNHEDEPASYFSLNGQRLNASYGETINTSFSMVLHLVNGSEVGIAYISVKANKTVSMTCQRQTNVSAPCRCQSMSRGMSTRSTPDCSCPDGFAFDGSLCLDINECDADPTPCDVTAHCNNTVGSFHCYCDPGYSLTDNGRGCTDSSETGSQLQASVLGPALGGALGGAGICVLVVTVIVVVRRSRKGVSGARRKRDKEAAIEPKLSTCHVHSNNAYDDVSLDRSSTALHNATGSACAVTSEQDKEYDILGRKRPPVEVQHNTIYSRLDVNTSK